jgi:phosphotransferase system enzyme I (PtsI)
MLKDPDFVRQVQGVIQREGKNAEFALVTVAQKYIKQFQALNDPYLRERTVDIMDVSRRALNHLRRQTPVSLAGLEEDIILVTHNLMPSDAVVMNKRRVKGLAMDMGGRTSHTAILSRAFEIPAVLGLSEITRTAKDGDFIIIDGNKGLVIINPDKAVLARYETTLQHYQKRESEFLDINNTLPAETRDGKHIDLCANIELAEETESALSHGAAGIGLFRSEFLLLQRGSVLSEEMQFKIYSQVTEQMGSRPVTIRTLDVGGDKTLPDIFFDEKNPLLGWRAIRFCLAGERQIFRTQLRALLRASAKGNMRIMFPMVSGVEELEDILSFVDEVKGELKAERLDFNPQVPIGIMIEVPAAAVTSDILAKKADFISLGTNDLIQYTIAVDRGNERVAYLYQPFHPAILRMIRMTIQSAHEAGIPAGMCGEMAGDPVLSVLLLGLGLDTFSMSALSIPVIRKIIRLITLEEAEEMAGAVMEMNSYRDIEEYVKEWMRKRFDFLTI